MLWILILSAASNDFYRFVLWLTSTRTESRTNTLWINWTLPNEEFQIDTMISMAAVQLLPRFHYRHMPSVWMQPYNWNYHWAWKTDILFRPLMTLKFWSTTSFYHSFICISYGTRIMKTVENSSPSCQICRYFIYSTFGKRQVQTEGTRTLQVHL